MYTIVVPLDGSAFAESALPMASAIAKRKYARLILLAAYEAPSLQYTPSPIWGDVAFLAGNPNLNAEAQGALLTYLNGAKKLVLDAFSELTVETVVVEGAPVSAISQYVSERHADLVVLSTHGRGGLSRAWLGSVADGLVRHADAPILLIRPQAMPDFSETVGAFSRVLLPVDGTRASEHAVQFAADVAGKGDAHYTLFRVVNPPPAVLQTMVSAQEVEQIASDLRVKAEQQLVRLEKQMWAGDFDVDSAVRVSFQPAQAILGFAAEIEADLIALATHGRGAIGRTFVGSIADKIIRASTTPVLVRRIDSDEDES